jgi:hypothetical protein
MNIHSEPGVEVTFSGRNGYEAELARAQTIFTVGQVLTVKAIEVGGWSTSVQFEECPNKWFNSVMFEDKE